MDSTLRKVISSRFVVLPALLAVLVGGWNLYIGQHNGGSVRGRVVAPDGSPIAAATVRMMEQNFTTNSDRGSTLTRADGSFEFTDNRSHNIQLRAEMSGYARSEQRLVRLYFRAQNVTLDEPLALRPLAK